MQVLKILINFNYLCIINIGNETQKCVVTYIQVKILHCLPKHNVVSLIIKKTKKTKFCGYSSKPLYSNIL